MKLLTHKESQEVRTKEAENISTTREILNALRDTPTRAKIGYVTGIFCELAAGTLFAFTSYSQQLKDIQDFNQSQINIVGAFGNFGQNFGPIGGNIYDQFGTRYAALIASLLLFVGYFFMFMITRGSLPGLSSTGGLSFSLFLAGLGSCTLYLTSLGSNVQNMPARCRAIVVSTLAVTYGLSATFYTGMYSAIFDSNNISTNFLFIGCTTSVIALISSFTLAPSVKHEHKGSTLLEDNEETAEEHSRLREILINLKEKLLSTTWWLFFIILFCGTGAGLLHINNSGNMIKSINNDQENPRATLNVVAIISAGQACGRLAFSATDYATFRRGWYLFGAMLLMAFAMLLNALILSEISHLYITSAFVGVAYGTFFSSIPTMVSEAWGLKYFSENWGYVLLAAAVSSYPFNAVAGAYYDHRVSVHASNLGEFTAPIDIHDCVGHDCYTGAFYFAFGMCIFGALLCLILVPRTKAGKRKPKKDTYHENNSIENAQTAPITKFSV